MKNKQEKVLSKEEQFAKIIDWGFRKVYGIEGEDWEKRIKKAVILTNLAEKDTKEGVYSKLKSSIDHFL